MKYTFASLSIIALLSLTIHLSSYPIEPTDSSVLPIIKKNKDDLEFDAIHGDTFGIKRASPDIETFVRNIIAELNDPELSNVRIRKLGKWTTCNGTCYKKGALATSYNNNHYIYIAEKGFRTLSEKEKRFVVGHELMHLKYDHTNPRKRITDAAAKSAPAGIATLLISCVGLSCLSTSSILKTFYSTYLTSLVWSACGFLEFYKDSRANELVADRESALRLNAFDGGIEFMNRIIEKQKQYATEMSHTHQAEEVRKKIKPLKFMLSTHPEPAERLKALEALKKKTTGKRTK